MSIRKSRRSRASRKSRAPRKSRVSRKGSRQGSGAGAARLVRLGVDPHKVQLALCVRALYEKLEKEGEPKGRGTLGRAFAICTASLQDKGYLKKGTNTPTAKGIARSLELAEEAGTAKKLDRYEEILSVGREGRPARRGAQIIDIEKLLPRKARKSRVTRKSKRKAA